MSDELTPEERSALRARIVGGAREIKPVGAHRGAWVAGSIAAVLVVAIAGGVAATTTLSTPQIATTPSPTATATVEPEPEPTPTATPQQTTAPVPTAAPERVVTLPASRFAFGCSDLAPSAAQYFGGEVPEVASTLPRLSGNAWLPGPMQYSFAQAGALYCEFGGYPSSWAVVAVVADVQDAAVDPREVITSCDVTTACEVVDGTYIFVGGRDDAAMGGGKSQLAMSVAASVREQVIASPPTPLRWSPPTATTPLTGDCEPILPPESVAGILQTTEPAAQRESAVGWDLDFWMLAGYWDAPVCSYGSANTSPYESPTLLFTSLPGGEWAYRAAVTGEQLAVAGKRSSDDARLTVGELSESEEYGDAFWVDVLVDGNWIRVEVPPTLSEPERRAVGIQIAEDIFASVYG